MSEISTLIFSLLAGSLLGAIFFGGLWWTIQRGVSSTQPAVWFLGSLLLRTAIAVTGFYFVSRGDWKRLLSCLFGFVLARIFVMWFTRAPSDKTSRMIEEGAR
jgi:F1F0 ATPase subunit 2